MSPLLRLQVLLARAGIASRRKCETLISEGRVKVNGSVVSELGAKADPERDEIIVDQVPISGAAHVYFLMYKPRGYVTTLQDPEGRPTVMELVPKPHTRLFPVGRLDYTTEGALILTNDGPLANGLMHPSRGVPKIYHAKIKNIVTEEELELLRRGVRLDDGTCTQPAKVRLLGSTSKHTWIEVTIKEGKNRQIHRMAEAIDHFVLKLTRVGYGPITLEGLNPGDIRPLKPSEIKALKQAADAPPTPKPTRTPPRPSPEKPAQRRTQPARFLASTNLRRKS